jgi:hypothetical protein
LIGPTSKAAEEKGSMWGNGVWLGAFVSMVIPFSISVFVGLRFKNFWVRLVFFLIFSVLGFILFAVFGGLWAGWHAAEDADGSIRAAFRNQLPGQIGFILAMTWFAIWRLPKRFTKTRNRIRITPTNSD